MRHTHTYTQCLLVQDTTRRVGWIPSEFATVGKIVDLKIGGKWNKGWKIVTTTAVHEAVYTEVHETDYKRQRKGSDI